MAVVEVERRGLRRNVYREAELIAQLKQRDSAAWAELFEEHHRTIFRAVLVQVNDSAVAEDLTGQVFLEALEGIGSYRARGKPIAAWLRRIARNRSLDWVRKQRRERLAVEHQQQGVDLAANHSPSGDAHRLLDQLKPEQREVIVLRFVEDRSLEDVAQLTNRSVGAVKSLQHRALNNLRNSLLIESDEEQP